MIMSARAKRQTTQAAKNIAHFAKWFVGITLRPYQAIAAQAIVDSVFARDGKTFVLIFSRQSGKDETLAIILLFLMLRFIEWGAEMVCAQPTFKPQTINAMERLKKRGANFGKKLTRTAGFILRMGQARVCYFSAEPTASQVGATADRILIMNEAQDIDPAIYDKRFSPMCASGYATKVFSGTSWTSDTLLSREKRAALIAEEQDGHRRVFIINCDEVGKHNKLYGLHVADEIKKLGRQHPLIRTQYFCEEIDSQAGMFNETRRALMTGDRPEQSTPTLGNIYALLVDVGGMDEKLLDLEGLGNPGRDSTTLSIVDIDLTTIETMQVPTYRIVHRQAWLGENHLATFGKLKAYGDAWQPRYIVVDATGIGEGLWAMLDRAFPTRVIPVKFTQQTKSEIGWGYLAIIETGRLRDCAPTDTVRIQYEKCQSEILPGPAKTLRWGVKDGTRGPDGLLVHDDHITADSLTAVLDPLHWSANTNMRAVEGFDPIERMEIF